MLFDNLQNKQIQKGKQESQFNTETMLPISEIKDGYCILKDGGIRAILRADGINLDLKNFDEIQTIYDLGAHKKKELEILFKEIKKLEVKKYDKIVIGGF